MPPITNKAERLARKVIVLVAVCHLLSLNSKTVTNLQSWGNLSEVQRSMEAVWSDYLLDNNGGATTSSSSSSIPSPVQCVNTTYCCGRWDVNADDWWQHRPHWGVVQQDDTTFCFAPFKNPNRTAMLRGLHWTQWNVDITDPQLTESVDAVAKPLPGPPDYETAYTVNCSNLCTVQPISSGYGASLGHLSSTFWYAFTRHIPFQVAKRGPWLYAVTSDTNHWAYCEDQDHSCLFMPLSPCSRIQPPQEKIGRRPNKDNHTQVLQSLWLKNYMIRPKQAMRHQLYVLGRPYHEKLQNGCIALHVRRSDAGVPRAPFRRYAAVQEYLDLLPPPPPAGPKPTVFLLTDDATTIDEIQKHHSDNSPYNWVYTDKNRNRGVEKGFDGHVPTQSDGPTELLYIEVEQELAAQYCRSFVHGRSGYANTLADRMIMAGMPPENHYQLDVSLPKEEVTKYHGRPWQEREQHLLQQVEEFYQKRKINTTQQ